jgi:hypothetical protein
VSDDASLDDFVGGDGNSDDATTPDDETGVADDDGVTNPPTDGVEPTTTTATWSPTGAACADCGTVVERRWRDDERFVCVDCKEW